MLLAGSQTRLVTACVCMSTAVKLVQYWLWLPGLLLDSPRDINARGSFRRVITGRRGHIETACPPDPNRSASALPKSRCQAKGHRWQKHWPKGGAPATSNSKTEVSLRYMAVEMQSLCLDQHITGHKRCPTEQDGYRWCQNVGGHDGLLYYLGCLLVLSSLM